MSEAPPTAPNRNALWAMALADALALMGVRHVCVGSGSRSAPLVWAFGADGRYAVHPHVDERSAAFFALGVGAQSGQPAAVVTTSGTAAANLYPAVVEASRSEIPLIALTADRPARLRGTDANQTIDQVDLFGRYPRASIDVALPEPTEAGLARLGAAVEEAWQAMLGPPPGPVHLNLQLAKPLEPTSVPGDVPPDLAARLPRVLTSAAGRARATQSSRRTGLEAGGELTEAGGTVAGAEGTVAGAGRDAGPGGAKAGMELVRRLQRAQRPLIVCGPNHRPTIGRAALELAASLAVPLLADPLSGARFGPGAGGWTMGSADLFLRSAEVAGSLRPDFVLRVGRAPTSASICRYLQRHSDVPQLILDPAHAWRDHLGTKADRLTGDPAAALQHAAADGNANEREDTPAAWAERWRAAERAAQAALAPILAGTWFEGGIAAAVAEALPAKTPWFIGNSMPVRDVDAFAAASDRPLQALGFRGASGIDGNVSGAFGAAAAAGRPAAALVGDLTLLHDAGALLANRPDGASLHIIVFQNRGGGIFHMLPIRDHDPPFTPHIVMPQTFEVGAVAAAAGISHRAVASVTELREALDSDTEDGGLRLTEAVVEREHNWEQRHAAIEAVQAAARDVV